MAAITDLTWQQLKEGFTELGLGDLLDLVKVSDATQTAPALYRLSFDLNKIQNWENIKLVDEGVIWFVSKLLDACKKAQDRANQNQAAGERLNAFPTPTITAAANGYVPVTRAVVGRHNLSSSGQIIGPNL